jgi:hypothetical protein
VQLIFLLFQNLCGTQIVAVDDSSNLGINRLRGVVRNGFLFTVRLAVEDFALFLAIGKGAHTI